MINLIVWNLLRGADLSDGNSFRQFQTAITTRYIVREGFKLAYETPVLGPPWSIPMEFPLYQHTVAAVVKLTGAPLEPAGRFVSMFYFWAALPAIWLLLRTWQIARETRLLTMALMLTCPIYLFYGRHFMIETTALFFGAWFLWAFRRALRTSSVLFGLLATVLGIAGGLAKITTFLNFGFAAALIMGVEIRRRPREWLRLLIWSGLIMVSPLAVSYEWVRFSDGIKAAHPVGSFLVSSKLHYFNFAYPGERQQFIVWQRFYDVTRDRLVTEVTLTLALLGLALSPRSRRWLVGASVLCYLSAVLVFTNLYYVHDYYYEANALFLVVAAALSLEALLTNQSIPRFARVLAIGLLLLSQVAGFWHTFNGAFTGPKPGPPLLAPVIARLTDQEDVIAVIGQDWNSRLLYYSDRRGLMLPSGFEQNRSALQQSVALLGSRRIGALVVAGNFREFPHAIIPQARILGVTLKPVIEGDGLQLYLRKDLLPSMTTRLAGQDFPSFKFNLDYDPAKDPQSVEIEDDLTRPVWHGKFPMASPAPQRTTGLFALTFADVNGYQVIGTHAPNSIYFQPPPGARQLRAVGAMFPGSWGGAEYSDGVVIEVWESLPDGNQQRLFQRALFPQDHPEDRAEFIIQLKLDRDFVGPVYLRVDPGPAGRANYDWFYWRSVKIY